jgi:diguanylate cyclase (GGDEF)-like protein
MTGVAMADETARIDRTQALPLHPVVAGVDADADAVALAAARSLMRAESRDEAARLLRSAVAALGGQVVPAWEGRRDALPPDLSLGIGQPVVAVPLSDAARTRLTLALPAIVEDALTAAAGCDSHAHQAWRASVDELTGVANRREILPRLRAAKSGDVICILDLDHFKQLNDAQGHIAGDEALRRLGRLLRDRTRTGDFVGRYGGDEFVLVMPATPIPVAIRRLRDLSRDFCRGQGGLSLSGGVASVDERGGMTAVDAADQAMYRAKARGRGRIEVSDDVRGDRA